MRAEAGPKRAIEGLGKAAVLIMAFGVVSIAMPGYGALAQGGPVQDLTGETCTGATKEIDGRTYCVMNGRLADCEAIEIDDLDNNVATFPDANLTSGSEPNHKDLPPIGVCDGGTQDTKLCDPAAPALCTAGGGTCESGLQSCEGAANYIDWANLAISTLSPDGGDPIGSVADHRILDWTAANDFTSLHGECLNDGSVHPKEDFTQSYLANNDRFIYFAQERRTNNGNSTFYWFLTHEAPIIDTSLCTTGGDRGQVQFKLSQGDVRVVVAFAGSGGITIFTNSFNGSTTGYLPPKGTQKDGSDGAVFNPGWLGFQRPVANLALLSAGDGDDAFAPWGGITNQGDIELDPDQFESGELAEWAVDLRDVFPGAQNLCGQELFVTGISRAATGDPDKITESADLKDIVGPKLFSFGAISTEVILTPVPCGDSFAYEVKVNGIDGQPITPDSVEWTCTATDDIPGDDDTVSMDILAETGNGTIPRNADGSPHALHCSVHVVAGGCADDPDGDATVEAALAAIVAEFQYEVDTCQVPNFIGTNNGTIPGGITFNPIITGGSGEYEVSWQILPADLGIFCPSTTSPQQHTCTVHVPDNVNCASVLVRILVRDAADRPLECDPFDGDVGYIKKATVVQFAQPPFCQNQISCGVLPPSCP